MNTGADTVRSRGRPSYWWRAGQERRLAMVQEQVELQQKRLLDAGCGVGTWTQALTRVGALACGVEVEAERVVEALRGPSGPVFAVGSVEHLPIPTGSFDLVFSHEVIEHVQDDLLAVCEAARVLRPGGHLILFAPTRGAPFETHGVVWRDRYVFGNIPLVNWLPRPLRNRLAPHVRVYGPQELRRLVAAAGLEITHHTAVFPGFDRLEASHPTVGRILRQLAGALERTPLRWLGLSHFLVARKPSGQNYERQGLPRSLALSQKEEKKRIPHHVDCRHGPENPTP